MSNSRIREPPRGVLDGIRKDAEANRLERLTGESQRGHGNAWSHGYLNQKPWHPLSYRNQRDLFLAEEAAVKAKADNDAAQAEFDREQEFYRSTQLMSGRERERLTDQQQLGFMYQKPPGYEAMLEKEKEEAVKRQRLENADHGVVGDGEGADAEGARNKGTRDMYGRRVATAEEFECLKGAPKEATAGADAHVKPFGVEIRMVKCLRCGKWGHSGTDRECPLRDQNPNDAFRMRLEDPLTLMKARNDLAKQEKGLQLKCVPGTSPLRGGGDRLADNQRILAPEVSGDEEELRDGENILDRLPKKERKRLIKDYMKKEKEKERAEKRAKLAAAQQFLAAAGVDTTAALAAGGAEESNGGSREKKKSKNSKKSRHKSKKHKRKRRDTDSDSSSSDSD